jgi:hypothetical protein
MKRTPIHAFVLTAALAPIPLAAEQGWTFQGSAGVVSNLESRLTIRQDGFETIRVDADYETRPFEDPPYYSLRVGRWSGRGGWEVELTHHKLYLRNPPPEVEHFAISHGYNLVTVNHAWDLRSFIVRLGAGAVAAHAESSVRGESFESGYHVTGPAFQAGVEKRLSLGDRWFLSLEGRITTARARVPVAGGEADAPNTALHGLVGLGWRSSARR